VFEEIATANEGDFVFEGIPCVQPRTDYAHLAFFFDGCRYRIKADVTEKCEIIPEDTTLLDFGVPPGCKCLIAIETAILESGKPSASDPYWN
jgi:hypothetical protein